MSNRMLRQEVHGVARHEQILLYGMCHKQTHILEKATTKLSSEVVKKDTGPVFQLQLLQFFRILRTYVKDTMQSVPL